MAYTDDIFKEHYSLRYNFKDIEAKILDGDELSDDELEYIANKANDYWENHPDVLNRFPRWKKYIAWVAGYQLYDYNKISKKLTEVPIARRRKLVFNKLRSFVRTILAKLASEAPQMGVVPKTTEDEDIEAAKIADKVIGGLSKKLGFIEQLNKLKLWIILCNRGFLRVFWDKDAHGTIGYRPETEEIFDDFTGEMTTKETGQQVELTEDGDIMVEAVPPFNCRVDPLYFDRNKWRWFLYGEEVDADDVEDEYELERGSLKEPSDVFDQGYGLELQDDNDLLVGRPDKRDEIGGRTIVFKELWTPYIYAFVAGSKTVEYGINPDGEIPFFAAEERLIPSDNYERGFTYNESMIKDAIPIQREYNRQASIISLALDRASKLKVLTPLGSLLSKKQWTNDYGVFIDYNRNAGEPHQMKMDPFPTDVHAYKASLEREMEGAFSIHQASFGQLPERASHASGTLVNLLLEQDDTVLDPLLNVINKISGEAWTLALRIIQKNYTASRLIKFVGENKQPGVVNFSGADLKGNTDVQVTTQSGLPRTRALRLEYLMKLREIGLLVDDKTTLEMLELGNVERIFEDELMHENVANRENMQIQNTEDVNPEETPKWMYPLEDKAAHLKVHLRLRLSARFNRLNENQQGALEAHIQATNEALQQEQEAAMQQQIEMAQAMKGGQAPGGQPV